jgi:hypothetical protein
MSFRSLLAAFTDNTNGTTDPDRTFAGYGGSRAMTIQTAGLLHVRVFVYVYNALSDHIQYLES